MHDQINNKSQTLRSFITLLTVILNFLNKFFLLLIFDKSTNLYEVLSYGDMVENWKRFEKKDFDFSKLFWNILMYQMWFKKNF